MKKLMTLVLIATLALSLAACGAKGAGNQGGMSGSQDASDQFALAGDENSIYGKITNITGNEIEIAVAEKPTDDDSSGDELSGTPMTPNENDSPIVADEIEDTTNDLEYTGDSKTFTIPAGVKITSMGEEINLSSLKKGDVVSISVDPEDPDTVVAVDKVN